MTFYTEAYRALQAEAWFAAAAVASSALEAVLLAKCFFQSEDVMKLPKWKALQGKKQINYGAFARSLDLGKLLEIAEELSWFSGSGIPKKFTATMGKNLSESEMRQMGELFGDESRVGELCAGHLRRYRNLLHPAVCLKEGVQPSPTVGTAATFVSLIALSSLFEAALEG